MCWRGVSRAVTERTRGVIFLPRPPPPHYFLRPKLLSWQHDNASRMPYITIFSPPLTIFLHPHYQQFCHAGKILGIQECKILDAAYLYAWNYTLSKIISHWTHNIPERWHNFAMILHYPLNMGLLYFNGRTISLGQTYLCSLFLPFWEDRKWAVENQQQQQQQQQQQWWEEK